MTRRMGPALLLLLAFAGAGVGSALAHPFGPPPTALVSARGASVFVEWQAQPDDGIAVGVEVGLLDERLIDEYLEAPVQTAPSERDELALTASEELRDYLEEHIVVTQDGQRCDFRVQPMGNFVREGARTVHQCPEPITAVEIELTMLHERHEAYRTFGIAEDATVQPAEVVFSVTAPRHAFDFTGEEPAPVRREGGGGVWPLVLVGGLAVGGVGVLALLLGGRSS